MEKLLSQSIGIIFILGLILSSVSCQLTMSGKGVPAGSGGIRSGDVLKLEQEIIIPAYEASLTLQNGQIKGGLSIDRFRASCRFVMQKLKKTAQKVKPDDFMIVNVRYWEDPFSFDYRYPISGPELITYEIEMHLRSEKQPEVHSLACQHDDDEADGHHLFLHEIQQALGNVAKITKVKIVK